MFGYVERHKKINRIHNNRRLYIYNIYIYIYLYVFVKEKEKKNNNKGGCNLTLSKINSL